VTDERVLLERAKQYDEEALGELYDRYAPRVYAYIFRRIGQAQVAEDITGDTFVRVIQAVQSERFWHTSFQAWLYRIAHNLVVDHYRRQPAAVEAELDERLVASADDLFVAADRRLSYQELGMAMRVIYSQEPEALRFGEGMTSREVADVLDKTVGAVEALQHRGLASLRRVLEEES
jgi:RNA polymerase sigma-70 factor (ECF subfamily)